jgi:hypothetical protein
VSTITWGIHEYPISRALIEDGRKNLVLDGPSNGLDITCPVRLVHGLQDEEVPLSVPLSLARRLRSQNVQVSSSRASVSYTSVLCDYMLRSRIWRSTLQRPCVTCLLSLCVFTHSSSLLCHSNAA